MHNWIARNILAPSLDYFRGTRTIACLRDLESSQWWPRDRVLILQNERLSRLLQHAYDNVPYYRLIFDERALKPTDIKSNADLARLPVLTKQIIRQNYARLQAPTQPGQKLIHTSTSGSTGEPLAFISTAEDQNNWGYARTFRARNWSGWQLGDRTVEFRLQSSPETAVNKIQNRIKRHLERVLQYSPLGISEETLPRIVSRLEAFQPEFLFGYPSTMYLLARYIQNNRAGNLNITAVMTDGEQLYDYQKELFRQVFHCDTFSFYSTWEVYDIAAECPQHTGHHIAAENVIAEIVDAAGNPVPAGKEGRILLTNLHNYAMPFIRYDIGDTGSISETACPCGREGLPLLINLNGRADTIILTRSGKQIPGRALPAKFLADLGVEQYQIVQESYEELVFSVVLDKEHPKEQENQVIQKIEARYRPILGPDIAIKVQFVGQIAPAKSGKRDIVISKLLS